MKRKLSKREGFLIGCLVGLVSGLLLLHREIDKARNLARIEAVIVSERVYQETQQKYFTIHNYPKKGKTLQIYLVHPDVVVEKYSEKFPWDKNPEVFGFYDRLQNEIWCPPDIATLIHEIKHVTEGGYHQ